MSQKILEDLQRQYPTNLNERRGRKPSRANFQETRPTHELTTHELLEVMDDAPEDDCQTVISNFVYLFDSSEMDRILSEFSPNAQAGLIDEMKVMMKLLEEFISKHQPIEITPIH